MEDSLIKDEQFNTYFEKNAELINTMGIEQKNAFKDQISNNGKGNRTVISENNEVIDIVSLINNTGDSAIATRLSTLFKTGSKEEDIISAYMAISPNIHDEHEALLNLRKVCDTLLRTISEDQNGIVIDLSTGEIDSIASLKQQIEAGIIEPDSVILMGEPDRELVELVKGSYSLEDQIGLLFDSEALSESHKEGLNEAFFDIGFLGREEYNDRANDFLNISNMASASYEDTIKRLKESDMSEEEIFMVLNTRNFVMFDQVLDAKMMLKLFHISKNKDSVQQSTLTRLTDEFKESKYANMIFDKNGNPSIDRATEVVTKWIRDENKYTLTEYLQKYNTFVGSQKNFSLDNLSDLNRENLTMVLARGAYAMQDASDPINQKIFKSLCKKLKIDPSKYGVMGYLGIKSESDLLQIKENAEINESNFDTKMSEIITGMERGENDQIVNNVLGSLNVGKTDTNRYANKKNAAVVLGLYSKYRDSENQPLATALKNYILDNEEYFSEYLKKDTKGKLEIDSKKMDEFDKKDKTYFERRRIVGLSDLLESRISTQKSQDRVDILDDSSKQSNLTSMLKRGYFATMVILSSPVYAVKTVINDIRERNNTDQTKEEQDRNTDEKKESLWTRMKKRFSKETKRLPEGQDQILEANGNSRKTASPTMTVMMAEASTDTQSFDERIKYEVEEPKTGVRQSKTEVGQLVAEEIVTGQENLTDKKQLPVKPEGEGR